MVRGMVLPWGNVSLSFFFEGGTETLAILLLLNFFDRIFKNAGKKTALSE